MRRRLAIVGVLAAVLAGASPANAGGSWIEVREVDGVGAGASTSGGWAAPGSILTMAGDFCHGQGAAPASGTWTAYLRAFEARGRTERVELAPASISDAPGRGCLLLSRTIFTVPDVAPGLYWIEVCGDPSCSFGVSDLVGGMVTVASTALEAELLRARIEDQDLIAHLARARRHLRTDAHRLEEVVADLEGSVHAVGETSTHPIVAWRLHNTRTIGSSDRWTRRTPAPHVSRGRRSYSVPCSFCSLPL